MHCQGLRQAQPERCELISVSFVIIDDLNVHRSRRCPNEAHPPQVIDADAVLASPVAAECFQAIARRRSQVSQLKRGGIGYRHSGMNVSSLRQTLPRHVKRQALGSSSLLTPLRAGVKHESGLVFCVMAQR